MADSLERFSLSGEAAASAMQVIGGQPTSANLGADRTKGSEGTGFMSDEALALRARRWFLEAWNHPMWKRYVREGEEDEGFYVGGELQWSYQGSQQDLDRLKAGNRVVVSLNHIQPLVDVLVGFERQNQYDLKALPQGESDRGADDAEILSWLLKFQQDQTETAETLSEVFEDGIIRGAGAIEVGVEWAYDPQGEIKVRKLRPGKNFLWDPYSELYDLTDARFCIKFKWAFLDDLESLFPDKIDEINAAVTSLDAKLAATSSDNVTSQGRPEDPYGRTNAHPHEAHENELAMYDPVGLRILVLEVWYRVNDRHYFAINQVTGKVEDSESRAEMAALVRSDPQRWKMVERVRRKMRMGTVLPSTYITLEHRESPYENDQDTYPFVIYKAKHKGEHIYGLVRNLKDPQRIENKKVSNALDLAGRFGAMRPMAPKGSLEDPRTLEDASDTSTVIYNKERGEPGYLVPPLEGIAKVLADLGQMLGENAVKTVSGINADLLGQKSDDTSGIAIARRQAQGQTIATVFFDNLKRTRKIVGQRLARRIQQVMTTEQVLRLVNPNTGEQRLVMINPRAAADMNEVEYKLWLSKQKDTQRPYILRDVSSLKYDIQIADSPSTPSARSTALLALLEIVRTMPQIMPDVVDKIVALADIPDRHEIVQRIQAREKASQTPPPPPPPPPPQLKINITAQTDPATAQQIAEGQQVGAGIQPGAGGPMPPGPGGPMPPAQPGPTGKAPEGMTRAVRPPAPGQPTAVPGLAPQVGPVPQSPRVANSPASPNNPKVVPQVLNHLGSPGQAPGVK